MRAGELAMDAGRGFKRLPTGDTERDLEDLPLARSGKPSWWKFQNTPCGILAIRWMPMQVALLDTAVALLVLGGGAGGAPLTLWAIAALVLVALPYLVLWVLSAPICVRMLLRRRLPFATSCVLWAILGVPAVVLGDVALMYLYPLDHPRQRPVGDFIRLRLATQMLFESPWQALLQCRFIASAVAAGHALAAATAAAGLTVSIVNLVLFFFTLKEVREVARSLDISFGRGLGNLLLISFDPAAPLLFALPSRPRVDFSAEGPLLDVHCDQIAKVLSTSDCLEEIVFAEENELSEQAVTMIVETLAQPRGARAAGPPYMQVDIAKCCHLSLEGLLTLAPSCARSIWLNAAMQLHGIRKICVSVGTLEDCGRVVASFAKVHDDSVNPRGDPEGFPVPELRVDVAAAKEEIVFSACELRIGAGCAEASWLHHCWRLPGLAVVHVSSPVLRDRLVEHIVRISESGGTTPFKLYVDGEVFDMQDNDFRGKGLSDKDIPWLMKRLEAGHAVYLAENNFTPEGRLKLLSTHKGHVELEPAAGLQPVHGLNARRVLDLSGDKVEFTTEQSQQVLDLLRARRDLCVKGHTTELGLAIRPELEDRQMLLKAVLDGFSETGSRRDGAELRMFGPERPNLDALAFDYRRQNVSDDDMWWLRLRFAEAQRFNLSSNDFTPEGRALLVRLARDTGSKVTMEALNGTDPVENLQAATRLLLGGQKLGKDGGAALAPVLLELKELAHLELQDNALGNEGTEALMPALRGLTFLQHLGLANNGVGKEGATALASALRGMKELERLELKGNAFWTEGMAALAGPLSELQKLIHLELDFINKGAAPSLARVLQELKQLQFLEIQSCCTFRDGTLNLEQLCFEAGRLWTVFQMQGVHRILATSETVDALGQVVTAFGNAYRDRVAEMPELVLKTAGVPDVLVYKSGELQVSVACTKAAWLSRCWKLAGLRRVLVTGQEVRNQLMEVLLETLMEAGSLPFTLVVDGAEIDPLASDLKNQGFTDNDLPWVKRRVALGNGAVDLSCNDFTANGRAELLQSIISSGKGEMILEPADGLQPMANIHTLDSLSLGAATLCGKPLGASGAASLAPTLKLLTQLEQLELRDNLLGKEGMAALAPSLQQLKKLRHLGLGGNALADEGAEELAVALKSLRELETLGLDVNNLGKQAAEALAPSLSKLEKLKNLYFIGNNFTDSGMDALAPTLNRLIKQGCVIDIYK